MMFLSAIKHEMRCLIFFIDEIEFGFSGSNIIANLRKLVD